MIIGIPNEIMADERRVSLTPDKVDLLAREGHTVLVEAGAGEAASFPDADFRRAGATLVRRAEDVYGEADMVVKVKEPQPPEYGLIRRDQIIFGYLHLAPEPKLTQALMSSGATAVAYETVQLEDGSLPLLYPMSEIAGKLAPQMAARLLQSDSGGPGKLLGGVPGTQFCRVVVVGGGTVGFNAAAAAAAAGAAVTVADVNLDRLRQINEISGGTLGTVVSSPAILAELVQEADVVVGAVLIPGAKAPKVIDKELLHDMRDGTIIIDVAIDQGGSVEAIRKTSISEPAYSVNGVTLCAVPNIPGMVANTSSTSLANATYPYVLELANSDLDAMIRDRSPLAMGINVYRGHVTHPAVAEALDLSYVSLTEACAA